MAQTTRRQFVQQTTFAAAAFCGPSLTALIPERGMAEVAEQNAAPVDAATMRKFASAITGSVITPVAPEYEPARQVFNCAFDRRPALIVRCAGPSDGGRALEFAQSHNLAVRGGGHSRAGFGVCDGGVVIDLSKMNQVKNRR